jgi:dehydrogenase/reductase SDR family member 4
MRTENHIKNSFSLEGKVAVITGASKGIGEAIAQVFAEQGATVVVNSRKSDALEQVVENLKNQGFSALAIAGQVGNAADVENIVQTTIKAYGRVDVLVNNAATNPVFGPLENTDERAFHKIMEVNVRAPFELAKQFLPIMKEQGSGSIINISSIGGVSPEQGLGIYSVSKAALISLTKVMAAEWGKYGIRANAICPGLIQTKFSEALWQNEAILKHVLKDIPLNRIGQPHEISSLALLLASEAGSYCTGSVFTADGGYLI